MTLPDATRFTVGVTNDQEYVDIVRSGGRRAEIYKQLRTLRHSYVDSFRSEYPHIPRRALGYNLDSLLEENNFNLAPALVGSESTCVLVLRAKLQRMPVVPAKAVVLVGHQDSGSSGDDVPAVLAHQPIALKGFDAKVT